MVKKKVFFLIRVGGVANLDKEEEGE